MSLKFLGYALYNAHLYNKSEISGGPARYHYQKYNHF